MRTAIRTMGRDLGIRIPKSVVQRLGLYVGMRVELEVVGRVLRIRPLRRRRPKYRLADLLAKLKPSHRHTEFVSDPPCGREIL